MLFMLYIIYYYQYIMLRPPVSYVASLGIFPNSDSHEAPNHCLLEDGQVRELVHLEPGQPVNRYM